MAMNIQDLSETHLRLIELALLGKAEYFIAVGETPEAKECYKLALLFDTECLLRDLAANKDAGIAS